MRTAEIKNQMKNDPRSCERNLFMQLRKKPEKKNQDFNGI